MARWSDYPLFCEVASLLFLRTDPVSRGEKCVRDLVLLTAALKSEYEIWATFLCLLFSIYFTFFILI